MMIWQSGSLSDAKGHLGRRVAKRFRLTVAQPNAARNEYVRGNRCDYVDQRLERHAKSTAKSE